jgi:hypothetical protein
METEPVSETLWFYLKNWDDGKCPDKQDTEKSHSFVAELLCITLPKGLHINLLS